MRLRQKCPPFCRGHFQINFLTSKLLRFDYLCNSISSYRYLLQIGELHPLQEILWADVTLGGNTGHPAILARALHCRRCRSGEAGAQVSFAWSMTLLTYELWTLLLEVMGNERDVRLGKGSLNLPNGTRHHAIESNSQSSPVATFTNMV